ncbi:MAG: potassium transporter [Deltaproteobacteria bacterium]|nr:potassium transporter [Deltaproteobacteria bacterium]MBW2072341.1 potassium transporter [Deltaproteobacteria bacterium]
MNGQIFWILGAGRFGTLATERLLRQKGDRQLVLVDRDRSRLAGVVDARVAKVEGDAIDFLDKNLHVMPDWLVPAVPLHVAFQWLCRRLSRRGSVSQLPVPAILDSRLPNPHRGSDGTLYTSFATFICPDDCEEPDGRCTFTGKPRKADLYRVLSEMAVPGYLTVVIRSQQLAPGVGGYQPAALQELLRQAEQSERQIIVATACRCHGVVNALRHRK